jgi:4-hydroxyacetophenone monooxygenase
MTSSGERRTTDRARFAEALESAHLPTLLMALVQLTGDRCWLGRRYRARRARGLDDDITGGLPPEEQAEVRAAALEAILAWRAGAPVAIPHPSDELIVEMLGASTGERVPPEYGPMFAEILDGGEPTAPRPESSVATGVRAMVVGAGISGLAAAIRLRELGIEVVIVERRDDVGGTWLDNRYPGAGVDVPSHLYSYSFASYDWSHYFARRDEIHDYIRRVADDFRLREHIRFGTEVVEARYRADRQRWRVLTRGPDGATGALEVNILVSAVGAFSAPVVPAIPGLASFQGPCVHTAGWPDGLDLTGLRVGVIGNGASAMQVVPAIAPSVGSLRVFQRSPQWVQPLGAMKDPIPEPVRFLLREVELYARWYRVRWAWVFHDKLHESFQKDPEWPHPERSLNAINDGHRAYFTDYLTDQLAQRPDLVEPLLPSYPPFGKRMLLDWGWYETLLRPGVELVTSPIERVGPHEVRTADGAGHELDAIVLATGFDVVRFISSFQVIGRSGVTLRETWDDDDGRAYLGLAVPDFPNFFCLYGPNTQPGHGGSLIHTVEAQIHYITDLLARMFALGLGAVECRQDVFDHYNKRVDEAHQAMIWTHGGMTTYYRNSRGRVVVNMPFRNLEYWRMTRHADLVEFHTEPLRTDAVGRPGGESSGATGVH